MNSNTWAYIIYLVCMAFIIYRVGGLCHRNGRVFILRMYHGDVTATDTINNILLVAYYLFNMGYAFLKLKNWERIDSTAALISSLSGNIGLLVLILAFTHYFNMALIYFLSKHTKPFTS